jgi:hypothetical protein
LQLCPAEEAPSDYTVHVRHQWRRSHNLCLPQMELRTRDYS